MNYALSCHHWPSSILRVADRLEVQYSLSSYSVATAAATKTTLRFAIIRKINYPLECI